MEKDQAQPAKRTGLSGWFLRLKSMLVIFSLVGLLASNIAAVLHAGFHDVLYAGIRKVLLIAGSAAADLATSRSKTAQIDQRVKTETSMLRKEVSDAHTRAKDVDSKRMALEADLQRERTNVQRVSRELGTERASLAKVSGELDGVNGRIKKLKPALEARLATGVSRNLAAIPAESIPYVGVAVVLAVTAADLKDACATMKDFNTLLVELGRGEKDPDFCGRKVPSREEVWADVKKNAKGTYQRAQVELDKAQMRLPEFTWPTPGDFCLKGIPGC